jgi:hypothetical protein
MDAKPLLLLAFVRKGLFCFDSPTACAFIIEGLLLLACTQSIKF